MDRKSPITTRLKLRKEVNAGARIFALGLVTLSLSGCMAPEPGTPAFTYEQAVKKEKEKIKVAKRSVEEVPKWFLNLPKDGLILHARGTATSSDMQLAIDKSVLSAKRSLADRISGLISSKIKEFVSETGSGEDLTVTNEVERVTTNLMTEVNVAGYRQVHSKLISQGKTYRSYVVLGYPLGKANQILMTQIKKNKLLDARIRASKGFKELEAEIKRARGT